MKILAVYSMKGGVGKTASAVNLAYWAARSGRRTLLIDLDPQGASSFYFRIKPSRKSWGKRFFKAYEELLQHIKASDYEHLDVIPAHLSFRHFDVLLNSLEKRRSRLKKILRGMKGEYDLVILDCPPSIGKLSESVFNAADRLLVPVIPTTLSERTFHQLLDFFEAEDYSRKKLLPFFSMVQQQKSMHRNTQSNLTNGKVRFLETSIPFSADVENMGEHRAPLDQFARSKPANQAYRQLWQEVESRL
ncbi:ParA family protein [Marinospirillum alkaliphilum]|uniref:Chromosome partitioning protein n=1 Tax=Marinospirillum alkaliphilum DSM 21637 TaxID=1122209 RepID=A0A1K1YVG1_9GAMM|nr:AAA family ATPase [Marinospirillum alkaliphilum]SFX65799.1 chromosome partitioning protein [Marinospirillum alkaliphilum DSM 21637]